MIVGSSVVSGLLIGTALSPIYTDVEAYRVSASGNEPRKPREGGGGSRGSMWSNMDTEQKKKK